MYDRRSFIKSGILLYGLSWSDWALCNKEFCEESVVTTTVSYQQSVCRWTMNDYSLNELCRMALLCGIGAIDLVGPKDWPVLKHYNLHASMCHGAEIGLTRGWSDVQYHDALIKNYSEYIDLVSENGYSNIICFSGNRNGIPCDTGIKNCALGLKKILKQAEKRGVVIHMELFNSKIDHPDYMCDSTAWGIELCRSLESDNFKLLFDIYHMQIQEGDIIRTIQQNHKYIGHYHTAGVPGRHEPDSTQELNHGAIASAIASTGFKGYVSHEFIPSEGKKHSVWYHLTKAVKTYGG